jgi:hypothetical protein
MYGTVQLVGLCRGGRGRGRYYYSVCRIKLEAPAVQNKGKQTLAASRKSPAATRSHFRNQRR